jgi:site-specific recombinase XerD
MNNREAQAEFAAYLSRRYGDRSTPRHYLSDLAIFLETVNQKWVGQIDGRDVDHFVAQQQKQGMSAATINRRLAALHTFFEHMAALEPETTQANPVNWRRHAPKQGRPVARDATDAEVAALLEQIESPRDQAIFGLMVGAGLRVGEVASLEMDDLHPPSESGGLARLIVRGKGRKERVVWLTPIWYDKLVSYQSMRAESRDPHLFLNQHSQGISVNGIQFRLQTYCRQAGLTLTCHQLRHTFARRLANQKMPIESISKLLGHSQIETTQRYTAGANPELQAEFEETMKQLELVDCHESIPSSPAQPLRPPRQEYPPDAAQLDEALARYAPFPAWLQQLLRAHLSRRWHDWKPHMAAQHAHRTSRELAACWQWLLDAFNLCGWHALRRCHVQAWMDDQLSRGLAPTTVIRSCNHLYSLLRFAQERGIDLHPQLFRIRPLKKPDALPRYLTDTEYQQLLQTVLVETEEAAAGPLHRTWFLTLAFTGIRLSELLDLRLSDLDLATRRLFIQEAKNQEGRVVFLTPSLLQHLQHYLAWRPQTATDHLFVTIQGQPLSSSAIYYRCRKWGAACGVHFSPHRLRHTFATRLLNHGVPLTSICRLLGHRTLYMTQRYARLYDSTVRQHFEDATAYIEGISISNWPQPDDHYVNTDAEHSTNSM